MCDVFFALRLVVSSTLQVAGKSEAVDGGFRRIQFLE